MTSTAGLPRVGFGCDVRCRDVEPREVPVERERSFDLRKVTSGAVAALVLIGLLLFILTNWRIGGDPRTERPGTKVLGKVETPPPAGTFLQWLSGPPRSEAILDGGVFTPGKPVILHERFEGPEPRWFHVEEIYDSVFDWLLRKHGTSRSVARFGVVADEGIARPVQPWVLPAPSDGVRGQSTFRFTDDLGRTSGMISSSRIAKIAWRVTGNAKADPARNGAFVVEGEAVIEGQATFAVDPRIRVVLMVPWGTGETDLRPYLSAYLGADALASSELQPYLPSRAPQGWRFESSTEILSGDVDKPASFRLRVRVLGRGRTLVALKAVDADHPDNVVVSDLFVLEDPLAQSPPEAKPSPSPSRAAPLPEPRPQPPASPPAPPVGEATPGGFAQVMRPQLPPTVSGLSPGSLARGASAQIVASGSGFSAGGATSFSGSGVAIKSAAVKSATELVLDVSVAADAPTGPRDLTYTDPAGSKATCTGCLRVTPPPTVSSVNPNIVFADLSPVKKTLLVNGTGFLKGLAVEFSGNGIVLDSLMVESPTRIRVDITILPEADYGSRNVVVRNPDGGVATCAKCLMMSRVPF
jgi:hypothetical protein